MGVVRPRAGGGHSAPRVPSGAVPLQQPQGLSRPALDLGHGYRSVFTCENPVSFALTICALFCVLL